MVIDSTLLLLYKEYLDYFGIDGEYNPNYEFNSFLFDIRKPKLFYDFFVPNFENLNLSKYDVFLKSTDSFMFYITRGRVLPF